MWFRSLTSTCCSSWKFIFTRTVTLYQALVRFLSAAAGENVLQSYGPRTGQGHQQPRGEGDRRPGRGRPAYCIHPPT